MSRGSAPFERPNHEYLGLPLYVLWSTKYLGALWEARLDQQPGHNHYKKSELLACQNRLNLTMKNLSKSFFYIYTFTLEMFQGNKHLQSGSNLRGPLHSWTKNSCQKPNIYKHKCSRYWAKKKKKRQKKKKRLSDLKEKAQSNLP